MLNVNELEKEIQKKIIDEVVYKDLIPKYSKQFPSERTFYLTENETAIEFNPAFGRILEWDLSPIQKIVDFHEAMNYAKENEKCIPYLSEFYSMIDLNQPKGSRIIGGEKGLFHKLVYQGKNKYWAMEDYCACTGAYIDLSRGFQDPEAGLNKNYLVLAKVLQDPTNFK